MAKQALGRGLSALLGDDRPETSEAAPVELDIDVIEPNPEQPRTRFAESALNDLALSIRANGIVQPLLVRRMDGHAPEARHALRRSARDDDPRGDLP